MLLKTETNYSFLQFYFLSFSVREQFFFQLKSGANGPHEVQALSNVAHGLPNPTMLKLQVFFAVDKYCVLCKVQSEFFSQKKVILKQEFAKF